MLYTSTYLPENKSVDINAFLLEYPSYHTDLLLDSTIPLHAHRCTRSWPCLFIFILLFRLAAKICSSPFYLSPQLLVYMPRTLPVHFHTFIHINRKDLPVHSSTVLHVHICTCSVYFFFFVITYTMTFQLIYWGTYTQIHPKINLPVYLHASLSSNHKDLPVTQLLVYMPIYVPVHNSTCSFWYFYSD